MPGAAGMSAARGASDNASQPGPASDDDAGASGAAGMRGLAGDPSPSASARTGNDVYLEEGVRRPGVRRCYTKESNDHPAIVNFRKVFYSADYAARDDAIAQLEAAEKEHPREEQYALFLGMAYLWRVKEPQDLVDDLRIIEGRRIGRRR
jgi:hypothetical protein